MKMKTSLFIVLLAFGCLIANAQPVAKGDKFLNLGVGLGSRLYSGSYYKTSVPPVTASYEVVVKENLFDEKSGLGLGGFVGYTANKWEYSGWGYKYTNILLGARGYFHYSLIDKLDTYAGVLLGYNIASSKEFGSTIPGYDYSASSGGFIWDGFVGGRYFFTDKLGAMLELGAGISYLNVGISLKM